MKTKNLVIFIFILISLVLYPAKSYGSNKNRVSREKFKVLKRKKIKKYNSNKFLRDLEIIEKGLAKDLYNGLGYLINGKNHKKIKKLKQKI